MQLGFTLGLFEEHAAVNAGSGSPAASSHADAVPLDGDGPEVGSTDVAKGGFGVKYLTKKPLLTLQLRDPQVQRHVLLQVSLGSLLRGATHVITRCSVV